MKKLAAGLVAAFALIAVTAMPASAMHSWNGYHWARTANPFTLKLGDNLTTDWKSYLSTASTDWTASNVMDTTIVPGLATNKRCRATTGRVEVCNGSYGQNGWLGIASINISGSHITQGTVKVNDTYFSMATYNNASEKLHVMCQEVGHTFGLDHQSTDGGSLNTCMDYYQNKTDDGISTHPNAHDYDELGIIYGHLDSTTTIGATALPSNVPDWSPASWRSSVYVDHLPNGDELVTFVYWANPIHGAL